MNRPYCSVIIACYNGESFLSSAVLSIVNQPMKELEVIIIDDGSTDRTPLICQELHCQDSRIKYVSIQNGGAGHARNVGLQLAEGNWIMYLDCDDLFLPNALNAHFLEKLKVYEQEHVDIVYTPRCDSDMQLTRDVSIQYAEETSVDTCVPKFEIWTSIYDTSFLKRNQIQFYEFKKQDVETAFRYLTFSQADKTVIDNSMLFCLHRENPIGNTHTWNLHNLRNIRCRVYYDLYRNHCRKGTEQHLLNVILIEISRYFNHCFRDGIYDQEDYVQLLMIRNKLWNRKNCVARIGITRYVVSTIQQMCVNAFKPKFRRKPNNINNQKPARYVEPDNLMDRLQAISDSLLK